MSRGKKWVLVLLLTLWMVMVAARFYHMGYRSGQIDALTGNIKYQLVTKPDSTKVWEEK